MKTLHFFFAFFGLLMVSGQTNFAVAEKGDGIFSLLRKQGLDPVKYYPDFVELNINNLKNGSELVLGEIYVIPDAPDSFKKMALSITDNAEDGLPLFEKELATIAAKSDKLKNAVIYLLPSERFNKEPNQVHYVEEQIVKNIANELMVNGAKVYLIDDKQTTEVLNKEIEYDFSTAESTIATQEKLKGYVDVINKLYLKNVGKYQRILVINVNEMAKLTRNFEVSLFHHGKNNESVRFAKNLQKVLNQYSIVHGQEDQSEIFTNSNNLYLATNVLPPITMIDIGNTENPSIEERISIASKEEILPNIVTSGVLTDYASNTLEK